MTEPRDTKPCDGLCPDDETFVKAFMNEASVRDTDQLVTHVMNCPRCRKKFQAMRQVRSELQAMDHGPADRSSSLRFGRRLIAVCGSALLLLGVAFFLLEQKRDTGDRGNGSGKLILTEPKEILTRPPSLFRWTPVKGVDGYNFKLVDEDLNTILRSGSRTTQIVLTDAVRAKLVRGKTYVWTVEARDDESRVLDSASSSFEIR